MIKLNNVYKSYKNGKNSYEVLKDINLQFGNNEFVSILGPSGCGKTTLLNILGGLDKIDSGEFYIDNINTKDYKSKDWDAYRNNYVGFVFQNFNLINKYNVYSNIELSLRLNGVKYKERKELICDALNKVGLSGYEKKSVKNLSGGEKQRVAIARAIVNNPRIILADEPTGSLDSENSIEVMKILKELSKEHLVILVTHNIDLANEYSDRVININDGKIEDNNIVKEDSEPKIIKKVHMPFLMNLSLSFKNIYSKLLRTLMIILAGSIGIVAVIMVLGVSSGVNEYIDHVQSSALSNYPIVITSSSTTTVTGSILNSRTPYPSTNEITVTTSYTNYNQVNNMDKDFLNYLSEMDESKYEVLNYNRSIRMRLLTKVDKEDPYMMLNNPSYFTEVIDDIDFLGTQYDVLSGKFPTEYNEICLVVDKYNAISSSVLSSMGMDNTKETYSFDEIIGKEYKLIENDNYYYYDEDRGYYRPRSSSSLKETLYNEAETTIKIVGILREKEDIAYALYGTGMLYSSKLTDYILESANNSQIVKDQIKYGYDKKVTTGEPYEEYVGDTIIMSVEYQYENDMINYSAVAQVTRVYIYSISFEDRIYVNDYVKAYPNGLARINFSDRMSNITNELTAFVKVLTKVLLLLALICLLVSIIMIATTNYISVIERTTEIGILRSVGARKIDIGIIFCTEAVIIGLLSGLLGIGLFYLARKPINDFIQQILIDYLDYARDAKGYNMIEFSNKLLLIAILGSVLITFISSIIPAIVGSIKKPVDALKANN